jgi:ribosomal protein S1
MKTKNYTILDYEPQEREELEKQYTKYFDDGEASKNFQGKDLETNSSVRVQIVKFDKEKGIALCETAFGQSIVIDINKEEKSLKKLGYPSIDIAEGQVLEVVVSKEPSGSFNGSVTAGYEKALKKELHAALKTNNTAYIVKVTSVCNGGFMVNLSGIPCFLPGSLAAANRIMDFSDYVGKQITVMIEIYDQRRDIFVVSFKKYLKKIIDSEVQNLSFASKYDGIVTGTSGSGVFVEWDSIFTGIIPFNESNKSITSELKTGDTVTFYVTDIKNPNRIVLSITEPNEKLKNIQEMKDSSYDVIDENSELKIYKAEIIKMKAFGAFVKLENGLSGLIEKEKLIHHIEEYGVGQLVDCSVLSVDLSTLKIQLTEV